MNERGTGVLAYSIIHYVKTLDFKDSCISHPLEESSDLQISAELNDNFEMRNKAVHKDMVNRVVKGLKVCFLNIRGLFKHLDELRLFSDEHKPHLICLNETR